jgi:hypothetical protein
MIATLGVAAVAVVLVAGLAGLATRPQPGATGDLAAGSSTPNGANGSVLPSFDLRGSAAPSAPTPSDQPSSSPSAPAAAPTSKPPVATVKLPIRGSGRDLGSSVLRAPTLDGGLYVALTHHDREVVMLLDDRGRPVAGWPRTLPAGTCWQLLAAADGTARVLCDAPAGVYDDGLQAAVTRIYALRPDARAVSGWPIDVESAFTGRMVGNDLTLLVRPYGGDTPETSTEMVHLVEVGQDGEVTDTGSDVAFECCQNDFAIGPDGTGVVTTHNGEYETATTDVVVFDFDGAGSGSPITLDGVASGPAFDADGRIDLALAPQTGSGTRRIELDRDGNRTGPQPTLWPFTATPSSIGMDDRQAAGPLVVSDDGLAFVLDETSGTAILAIDRADTVPDSWPYRSRLGLQRDDDCGYDTGCPSVRVQPVASADGTLYMALAAAEGSSTGGRIVALDRSCHVRAGWPVILKRPGSAFWWLTPMPIGGVWALAIEPEGTTSPPRCCRSLRRGRSAGQRRSSSHRAGAPVRRATTPWSSRRCPARVAANRAGD